jgi:hypothetical protein
MEAEQEAGEKATRETSLPREEVGEWPGDPLVTSAVPRREVLSFSKMLSGAFISVTAG